MFGVIGKEAGYCSWLHAGAVLIFDDCYCEFIKQVYFKCVQVERTGSEGFMPLLFILACLPLDK